VIIDEKCADDMKPEFKKEVGQFIKNVASQHSAPYLQQVELQSNSDEKAELAKYVA